MKTSQFIGKHLDLSIAQAIANQMEVDFSYKPPDNEQGNSFGYVTIYLSAFEHRNMVKTGRNAYSLEIGIDEDRIVNIVRVGHCHICGQGNDDELQRFPHESLEVQAQNVLDKLTT